MLCFFFLCRGLSSNAAAAEFFWDPLMNASLNAPWQFGYLQSAFTRTLVDSLKAVMTRAYLYKSQFVSLLACHRCPGALSASSLTPFLLI